MSIQERVLNNSSSWLDLAHKGEISFETASLLINAFELGMAELAEEINMPSSEAYEQVADVNQYIKSLGHEVVYPKASTDTGSIIKIIKNVKSIVNFTSRKTQNQIENLQRK